VIVTVTLNPSLQVEYDAGHVRLGAANKVRRVRYRAGGRGLAVARYLHTFGHDVVAAGLAGGSTGELIRNELGRAGVATHFTPITAESRRVVAITEGQDSRVTSFSEPAPYITTEELGRLAGDYLGLLNGATAVVLCGSLPDGLPDETYASLTSYATGSGVPVILEAGGSALRHAAARGPALVIPDSAGPGLAHGLPATGSASVVLLADGEVLVRSPKGEWRAELADGGQHDAAFRDALVAGFVPGIVLGWSWPDMLRHAVALAESVLPSGDADLADYERLLADVVVTGPAGAA
jgi:tagatose 6-phosphate kinase